MIKKKKEKRCFICGFRNCICTLELKKKLKQHHQKIIKQSNEIAIITLGAL